MFDFILDGGNGKHKPSDFGWGYICGQSNTRSYEGKVHKVLYVPYYINWWSDVMHINLVNKDMDNNFEDFLEGQF